MTCVRVALVSVTALVLTGVVLERTTSSSAAIDVDAFVKLNEDHIAQYIDTDDADSTRQLMKEMLVDEFIELSGQSLHHAGRALAPSSSLPVSVLRDMSAATYRDGACDALDSWTVRRTTVNSSRFLVAHSTTSDLMVIAFRGASNVDNWSQNLDFKLTELDSDAFPLCNPVHRLSFLFPISIPCRVHRGFQQQFLEIRNEVSEAIEWAQEDAGRPLSVQFTGHSLGGALATLAAMSFKAHGYSIADVVTFDAPMTGNIAQAQYATGLGIVYERHVHRDDLLPSLPPLLFRHPQAGKYYPTTIFEDGQRYTGRLRISQVVIDSNPHLQNMRESPCLYR